MGRVLMGKVLNGQGDLMEKVYVFLHDVKYFKDIFS